MRVGEGPLQLAHLRLGESRALPAAPGVRARPPGSSLVVDYRDGEDKSVKTTVVTCIGFMTSKSE